MARTVTLDVDAGEAIHIGADTIVRLVYKSGRRARLEVSTEYRVKLDKTPEAPPRPTGTSDVPTTPPRPPAPPRI